MVTMEMFGFYGNVTTVASCGDKCDIGVVLLSQTNVTILMLRNVSPYLSLSLSLSLCVCVCVCELLI